MRKSASGDRTNGSSADRPGVSRSEHWVRSPLSFSRSQRKKLLLFASDFWKCLHQGVFVILLQDSEFQPTARRDLVVMPGLDVSFAAEVVPTVPYGHEDYGRWVKSCPPPPLSLSLSFSHSLSLSLSLSPCLFIHCHFLPSFSLFSPVHSMCLCGCIEDIP